METYSDSVEQQQPQTPRNRSVGDQEQLTHAPQMKNTIVGIEQGQPQAPKSVTGGNEQQQPQALNKPAANGKKSVEKARSLVLLLATLAVTITYQAGLDPPGGLWEDDGAGYKSGDPILLTTNPRRFKAFFYCNSVAFVASLVAIILVKLRAPLKYHALEAAMILDLFGLIGAYAAGSCRDVSTSIYAMALAGAVLVYVVIHVVFFTLDHHDNNNRRRNYEDFLREQEEEHDLLEKRRKRLLLFAILSATITYQAGLTPPSGFRLQDDMSGHHAGEPVLLYNYPRRYKTFFYCNSVSFMLSIALIILLVNPNLYRPAIRSNALSICTAAGMLSLVGSYAAGSTQHLKTSIYIFVLVVVVLIVVVVVIVFFAKRWRQLEAQHQPHEDNNTDAVEDRRKIELHSKRKYVMLLGILAASVTYQAGLKPPGGMWQSDGVGHAAGNPIMYYNRRLRYQAFFYINSISFVASIVVIILLLLPSLQKQWWLLRAMNMTVALDLFGLLIAYAVGSSRSWKSTGHVLAIVIAVLAYVVVHVLLSRFIGRDKKS
ncbi:hypothetical protein PR202_ga03540 [Eleusine coracana subsp. coracana]|uniref:PGG domain-containing protein n=1 Tax=Eleusine coracana subsp. coracana TaxID=191504 RepID=A0AAV5BPN5_ELECO|nr:hypothetical protein PR202_ga03540 [Eleusine coracana subsp. coracana]